MQIIDVDLGVKEKKKGYTKPEPVDLDSAVEEIANRYPKTSRIVYSAPLNAIMEQQEREFGEWNLVCRSVGHKR